MHEHNSFITLTYNKEHLPLDRSLDLDHWQRFAKRVHKRYGAFRYFHCGEYGEENGRPHYHACVFGLDWIEDRKPFKIERENQTYVSDTLEKLWGNGFTVIGSLTFQSAAYVARYIMKKVNGPLQDYHYVDKTTGLIKKPEYTTMSRRPGIGTSWFDKYHADVFPSDEVVVGGKRSRPPKFYDSLYKILDEQGAELMKSRRRAAGSKYDENNTPDRLEVRETVQLAQIKQLKRTI